MVILAVASLSLELFYQSSKQEMHRMVRDELETMARTGAAQISGDEHFRLTSAETGSAKHKKILQSLIRFHESLPRVIFVYTAIEKAGDVYFVLDTEGYIGEKAGHVGKNDLFAKYLQPDPTLIESLRLGKADSNETPWTDELGTFMSGFAPITNSQGKVVAVLGVDYSMDEVSAAIDRLKKFLYKAFALAFTFSFLIAAGVFFLMLVAMRNKQANRRVSEENEVLAEICRRTTNLVLISDSLGRIDWVNEAFQRVTGYRLEEVKGKKFGSILNGPGTNPEILEHMAISLEKGKGFRVELLNYSSRGVPCWLDIEVLPMRDAAGKIVRFLAVESDITLRKEAEQKMSRAMHAAEGGSRAKSEFVATISHEIRSPMNSILGFSELLEMTNLEAGQREYVKNIRSSGRALLNLISDILDFSKIESGAIDFEAKNVALPQLVEEVMDTFKPLVLQKNLHIEAKFEVNFPPVAHLDAYRLRQVLTNLISNAIKFTEQGGVWVTSSYNAELNLIQFCIEDTGPGIPLDQLSMLFEPFHQVDASTSRKHGGTGLGLAIAKRIVIRMGGKVWIESDFGKGSRFYFSIPYVSARPEVAFTPFAKDAGGKMVGQKEWESLRVLLVEDNEMNRRVAELMLKKLGVTPIFASNGLEALSKLGNYEFDLILMDVQMPKMDGKQLTQEIRKNPRWANIHIVALTASASTEEREACLASGMDDFVSKPITIESIRVLIERYWARRHSDSEVSSS